jgi:hypothetical protein
MLVSMIECSSGICQSQTFFFSVRLLVGNEQAHTFHEVAACKRNCHKRFAGFGAIAKAHVRIFMLMNFHSSIVAIFARSNSS